MDRIVAVVRSTLLVLILASGCDEGTSQRHAPLRGEDPGAPSTVAGSDLGAPLPKPSSLRARFQGAPVVVVGTVARVTAGFGVNEHGDELILTKVDLEVQETLRGEDRKRLVFELEGGTVGELTLKVSDLPTLAVGDRGVFALRRAADDQTWVPHGRSRGLLLVRTTRDIARIRSALQVGR